MKRKRIIHVIDNLGRGGAETLLVDLLPDLSSEYDIILVTLDEKLDFEPCQIVCKERICLHYKGVRDLLPAAIRLKKIIQKYQPDLVRSQLYWSTIVTRLACPKEIPLFFSVHATMNEDPIAFHKRFFLKLLEKLTYRKSQIMIGVTQAVIDSFIAVHPSHGATFLLHNYVREAFFTKEHRATTGNDILKLVSVGNLRLIKNMPYLVEALRHLPQEKLSLDIYGEGPIRDELAQMIETYQLFNIRLMGRRNDIYNVLPEYDVYISPSTVEGFGIAVAEAMSVGLPVIISDIPVYREVGGDKANYLNNTDPKTLVKIIYSILKNEIDLKKQSDENRQYARRKFSKAGYLLKLNAIYQVGENN
ncbi:MAG: glycosyltransferase [Chitinophagaceae bacterium]|nr:MAG: glycosyltransferase [Chitinophagaceae bacterium]